MSDEKDTKADDAKADDAKADDAKADEPKADEPKADEPKADEVPAPAADEVPAPAADEVPEPVGPSAPEPVAPALVPVGTLVEFETAEELMAACEKVRDAGWSHWDAHTPYPVHGLDAAMGIKPTILPWIVFAGGITGCLVGLGMQFYMNGVELPFSLADTLADPFLPSGYPYVASGKPIYSVPANIPVAFELTILLSAFGAFFSVWGLNKLPQFWHPVFTSTRFRRATDDRFFISFEVEDPMFDPGRTRAFAETLGGAYVEDLVGEEEEA